MLKPMGPQAHGLLRGPWGPTWVGHSDKGVYHRGVGPIVAYCCLCGIDGGPPLMDAEEKFHGTTSREALLGGFQATGGPEPFESHPNP